MNKEEFSPLCWSTKARLIMADLRIVPRAIVVLYFTAGYQVMDWFMAIKVPTMEQGAFVVTFAGILPAVLTLYSKHGNQKQEV